MNLRLVLCLLSVLLTGIVFNGCGGGNANMAYNYYLTSEEPLLETGPYQQDPPKRMLPVGTRVRIISAAGAFAQVATVREETGWVPASALRIQDSTTDNIYGGNQGPRKNYSGW